MVHCYIVRWYILYDSQLHRMQYLILLDIFLYLLYIYIYIYILYFTIDCISIYNTYLAEKLHFLLKPYN